MRCGGRVVAECNFIGLGSSVCCSYVFCKILLHYFSIQRINLSENQAPKGHRVLLNHFWLNILSLHNKWGLPSHISVHRFLSLITSAPSTTDSFFSDAYSSEFGPQLQTCPCTHTYIHGIDLPLKVCLLDVLLLNWISHSSVQPFRCVDFCAPALGWLEVCFAASITAFFPVSLKKQAAVFLG